jgi:transcriptional regulator with PAS, ATPase and Fis domain
VGLALHPHDGTAPQALLACAGERLRATPGQASVPGVVVESPALRAVYALAERAAKGNINVLILGETGSGKELLAHTVHSLSARAEQPFVAVNCAALADSLIESELFGHERGAFTGAVQAKPGLIESASGGTLFLDEIGEMALGVQAKLLRVLETRQVLRVGGLKPRPIDVRVIAATNRDLEEEIAEKRFRRDLYFRLNGMTLELPPLRERLEELAPLARHFLQLAAEPLGRPAPELTPQALLALRSYAWPGNIRELRNVMERAVLLAAGQEITTDHLPMATMRRTAASLSAASRQAPGARTDPGPAPQLREIERQAIIDALERCAGNQTRAAELLGMSRRTFCKRLTEHRIPRPRA